MQIHPGSPKHQDEALNSNSAATLAGITRRQTNGKRLLNGGLALAGLGLALIYVSQGWGGYDYLPGGRKVALGVILLMLAGLALARLRLSARPTGPAELFLRTLRNVRVREALLPGGLVVFGLALRIWGVNFGLPYLEHVDEWTVAERALHVMQSGSFDPYDYQHPGLTENDRQAFTYPTLTTYLQTGVFSLRFLLGVGSGQYDGTSILSDPATKNNFYLWGRALTAIIGAGTVWLVYLLGRQAYSRAAGLIAALFLTFFYLHVLNSHWLTTDVPSGFMVLLPFLFILPVLEGREDRKFYLMAGFTAGLAVATKYNNALILAPLLLAHLLSRPARNWINWNITLALAAVLAGFTAGAPFVFWHFPQFLTDLAAIVKHYQITGHIGYEASDNWLQYVSFMMAENAVVVLLGLGGIALAAARHSRRDLVLLAFPLLTYLQLSAYKVNFSRNLMPIIPFLVIFAGLFLASGFKWLLACWPDHKLNDIRLTNLALGGLAALAVLSPALAIWRYDAYNAQPTNRARATAWIEQNLPRGAKLWLEPFSTDLLPRSNYRLDGGQGALSNPPEWYRANGYHYLALSEAYYKEASESGNAVVRAGYRALTEGPYPAGMELAQDFKKNSTDRPGARIVVLKTGLPLLLNREELASQARPLNFNFSEQIKLAGWQAPPAIKAGTTFTVALYWETLRTPPFNYSTFIHIINKENQIVAQIDLAPFAGTRPTSGWQPGEISRDDYPLTLPAQMKADNYSLVIGLYQAPNGPRLNLQDGLSEVQIGTISVVGER